MVSAGVHYTALGGEIVLFGSDISAVSAAAVEKQRLVWTDGKLAADLRGGTGLVYVPLVSGAESAECICTDLHYCVNMDRSYLIV